MVVAAELSTFFQALAVGIAVALVVLAWAFALVDLFRRHDLHGWAKAGWLLVILLLPLLGPAIYIAYRPVQATDIARIDEAAEHDQQRAAAHATDALHKLAELHDRGKISDEEYEAQKTKLLGR